MAGSLKTFWDVVMGRLPKRPPGGWTVAEIQARGSKQGFATFAGCQPDELLDLVLKRSWWRTWVWPDFSVIYGRAGARFGATGVGAAVGGPLGAGIEAVVGTGQLDRSARVGAQAAVPDDGCFRPELMTPAVTFAARVLALNFFGVALYFVSLIICGAFMMISPKIIEFIISNFQFHTHNNISFRNMHDLIIYSLAMFYLMAMIVLLTAQHRIIFITCIKPSLDYCAIVAGGLLSFVIIFPILAIMLFFDFLDVFYGTNMGGRRSLILFSPVCIFAVIFGLPMFAAASCLMFRIRRTGKLPNCLKLET